MMCKKVKRKMNNIKYTFSDDGKTGYGKLSDGAIFIFDADMIDKIVNVKFYRNHKDAEKEKTYIIDSKGRPLHDYLFAHKSGYEIDHINRDTFDNRRCNIRYCTHQQNQCNQPLQANNTSGVTGVSYYAPRHKYRARIKVCQHDIHLGYYKTFEQAVQARNVGMSCMFGEYGVYDKTAPIPNWIEEKVINICKRFAELSICKAFVDFIEETDEAVILNAE